MSEFSLKEQILMREISDVHPRQLSTVAFLASDVIISIQILINVKVWCILIILYFIFMIAFAGAAIVFFELEGDMLNYFNQLNQMAEARARAITVRVQGSELPLWDYPRSRFKWLYNNQFKLKPIICVGIIFGVMFFFGSLFLGIKLPDLIVLLRRLLFRGAF
jgi:hypothetical protein